MNPILLGLLSLAAFDFALVRLLLLAGQLFDNHVLGYYARTLASFSPPALSYSTNLSHPRL